MHSLYSYILESVILQLVRKSPAGGKIIIPKPVNFTKRKQSGSWRDKGVEIRFLIGMGQLAVSPLYLPVYL